MMATLVSLKQQTQQPHHRHLNPMQQNQLTRSLERILEDAHLSGELKLSGRKLKDFPKVAGKYNLNDTVIAGKFPVSYPKITDYRKNTPSFFFVTMFCRWVFFYFSFGFFFLYKPNQKYWKRKKIDRKQFCVHNTQFSLCMKKECEENWLSFGHNQTKKKNINNFSIFRTRFLAMLFVHMPVVYLYIYIDINIR